MAASILLNSIYGGAGGGGEISVLVQTALPEEVAEGTIVVVVDELPTPLLSPIISDTEPENPQDGQIWIHTAKNPDNHIGETGADAVLLIGAMAYESDAAEWSNRSAFYPLEGEWVQFSREYTIMGYEWHYGNSSPLLRRIEAAEGLEATAAVGTLPGASDFDTMPIYKGIRRCNLDANGTVNAYEGDSGYTVAGTNGEVMVEIPKFWYKVENDASLKIRRFMIADKPVEGFAVFPLFDRGDGNVRSRAYIGAYETGAAYTSKSGVAPLVNQTRAVTRTGIKAKGTGWSIQDLTARIAVAELFRIEYATMDAQAAIGKGNSATTAALATGRTNSIAGHTGREAGTDGATSVLYRGIENLWGDVWEWVDGLNYNGGVLYFCLDQTKFADDTATNYTALSFTVPTNLSASYATAIGYDANRPWAGLPAVFSGGSESTYLTDACWSSTAWRVALGSGSWSYGGACGVSPWSWHNAATSAYASLGSRLLYIP